LSAVAASPGTGAPENLAAVRKTAVIQAGNLFPTSRTSPDPTQVVTARLPVEVGTPTRLTATCNCTPGTPEAEQFKALVVEVKAPGGKVFTGPLTQLDTVVTKVAEDVTVRVWLAETGKPQAQGVTTQWSFTAESAG
jgi:hypothetical protein